MVIYLANTNREGHMGGYSGTARLHVALAKYSQDRKHQRGFLFFSFFFLSNIKEGFLEKHLFEKRTPKWVLPAGLRFGAWTLDAVHGC